MMGGPGRVGVDAFASGTHLAQWCAPKGATSITQAFDFKPGGVWDATVEGRDGSAYPNYWTWKEIVPPERIVWLYGMGKDDPHPVQTTLTLAEHGATTEATLRLVFGSKEERDERVTKYGAAQGAKLTLDALARYAATLKGK